MPSPTPAAPRPTDPRDIPARRRRVMVAVLATLAGAAAGTAIAHSPAVQGRAQPDTAVAYTAVLDAVADLDPDDVAVAVDPLYGGSTRLQVTAADGQPLPDAIGGTDQVATHFPTEVTGEVIAALVASGHDPTSSPATLDRSLADVILSFGPLLLLLTVGGAYAAHRARAFTGSRPIADVPDTRFGDVAGIDEVVDELQELVDYLHDPAAYDAVGAVPPRGILLAGPPGTGKTLLARAVAGEAHVPFYSVSGSGFMEVFAGIGASRIRKLFAAARRHRDGAIVFIDEIDAIGRARSGATTPGAANETEREQTLNQMLEAMDGFATTGNVLVIAATNRPDILDDALTRPGRFDRTITVGLPTPAGREAILRVHLAGRAEDVDLGPIVRRTTGRTGAWLAGLVTTAARHAARDRSVTIDADHLDSALEELSLGRARNGDDIVATDRTVTAWHEAGHAVAGLLLPDADDPMKATIVPRGGSGGSTWTLPAEGTYRTTRQLRARLLVTLAGRAAEKVLLDGDYTQGAAGDLRAATDTATAMVCELGMSPDVGPVVLDDHARAVGAAADTAAGAIRTLLVDAQRAADTLVSDHADVVRAVAELLLERETVDVATIRTHLAGTVGDIPTAPSTFVDQAPAA